MHQASSVGAWRFPSSFRSVPQPGPLGTLRTPFSMTGGAVTMSSFQGM